MPLKNLEQALRIILTPLFLIWTLTLSSQGASPTTAETQSPGVERKATNPGIPGGSLDAHEKAGGHLLERHVGKTEEQLRRRLQSETRISAASSFTDRPVADASVSACIASNQRKITAWLKGDQDRLVISHRATAPVGISISRGTTKARDANGTRLVLVRDKRFAGGWRILTGYPEL